MTNPALRSGRSSHRPALAAAVGLGSITLDSVLVTPGHTLRVGGERGCDLPFTCDPADVVQRDHGAWIVRIPDGVDRDGPVSESRTVRLHDWDGGITLRGDGQAWLRLWPTRPERFTGRDPLAGPRWLVSRALPALWLALGLTLGVGTFALWASTAVRGDLGALSLGDGPLGQGGDLERVASLGDGDQAAGVATNVWASNPRPPVPDPDALEDADADATEPDPEPPAEVTPEPEPRSTPEPRTPPVSDPVTAPEAAPDPAIDPTPGPTTTDTAAPDDADAGVRGDEGGSRGRKHGGAGGFGVGGGTDDGYADRSDSVHALERSLMACVQGEETHRVRLVVGLDGKAETRTLDFAQGTWDRAERNCVSDAILEWAFPEGEEDYQVSLRMRKGSRRHRGA